MYAGRDTTSTRTGRRLSLAAEAYAALKHRLLIGDFRLGARLAETALAEQLEMSRTPIREALSRLHTEGLLVRQPDGGFMPAAPDLHTISELYEVRRSLEMTALNRGRHDLAQLTHLRSEWVAMATPATDDDCSPEFVVHDEDFHLRLATASGNEALAGLLASVNERIRIVRMHDFLTVDRVADTISEHTAILDALIDADGATAVARLSDHLEISEHVVEQRAAVALSRMIGGRRG
ncbi:MAG: GntR family transcriptional regulator [Actinomycetota bacterium]